MLSVKIWDVKKNKKKQLFSIIIQEIISTILTLMEDPLDHKFEYVFIMR